MRALTDLIYQRASGLDRNDAIRIGENQIALVRLWVSGETPATASELAAKMIASARAQRTRVPAWRRRVRDGAGQSKAVNQ